MEWVMRLLMEPRRLYSRYLIRYPKFMYYFVKHALGFTPANHLAPESAISSANANGRSMSR